MCSLQDQSTGSTASSPKRERQSAARFGNESRPISADDDYDAYVMGLWKKHLSETERSCGKNSSHWKAWLKGLDLNPIVDVVDEILVAEMESDCDEVGSEEDSEDLPMPTTDSGMGLPASTDEDRQVEPAVYHE